MITLSQLHCHVGENGLLQDISLTLQHGCIALVGPNGAGKSTLLKLLADGGRDFTQARIRGDMYLDAKPLAKIPADLLARRRAFLPQHHAESLQLPVTDIIAMAAWPHGGGNAAENLQREALDIWELGALATRHYNRLSGGERQRVQLARTWLQMRLQAEPTKRIWLLDEPQNALDLPHQQRLQQQLRTETANGALVIFSTHDINFALHTADRVIALREGRMHADAGSSAIADPALLQDVFGVRFTRLVNPDDNNVWLVTG